MATSVPAMEVERGRVSYAGFAPRLAAQLLDAVLFGLAVMLWTLTVDGLPSSGRLDVGAMFLRSDWINEILIGAITIVLWCRYAATPGKLLMDCQVVDAQTGAPPGWRQALIRYVSYYLSLLPLGLGFFWILWDPKRQGFHDKLAGTVVLSPARLDRGDESQKSLQHLVGELR